MIVEDGILPPTLDQEQSPQSDLKILENRLQELVDQARKLRPNEAQYFLQQNKAKDLADQIRKLRQEKKEVEPKSNEYSLPSKDLYPLPIRADIVQRLDESEGTVVGLEQAIQQADQQIKSLIELSQRNEVALVQAVAEIRQDNNTPKLEQLNELLTHITVIKKQISQGGDIAPQIEKLIATLDSEDVTEQQNYYLPDQRERQAFGQATSLRQLVNRVLLSREGYYQQQKQKYLENTTSKYYSLLTQLPDVLFRFARVLYIEPNKKTTLGENNTPEKQLALHQDSWQEYIQNSQQLELNEQWLRMLENWINANQHSLSEVKTSNFWAENLFDLLVKEAKIAQSNIDINRRQLDDFKYKLNHETDRVIDELVVRAENDLQLLNSQFLTYDNAGTLYEANGSFIPLETVVLRDRALEAYSQLNKLVTLSGSQDRNFVTFRLKDMKDDLESLSFRIDSASKFNKEQPQSQGILWHTGNYDALINKVFRSGHLASRKSQLGLFGEATFSTAGVSKMTKDTVTVIENGQPVELTWDQYHERNENSGLGKDLYQEAFQIAFSKNGYDQRYFKGVAFLFSEASLQSKSQFMEADGFHFFDKDYKTGHSDSPGFDIDFDKEPFVVAVTAEKATELQQRLTSILIETKGMSQEQVEQWLKNHIVVIQSDSEREDLNKTAYSLMEKQGLRPVEAGYLVPTGERGENSIRQLHQLFAYRSSSELENDIDAEKKTFDTDAVKAEIEKDEMTPKSLINLLRTDTELNELYIANAGVFERYSIGQHTEMALTQFERYFGHTMEKGKRAFMRLVLALHDIGKSMSVRKTGTVVEQHTYTLPILSRVMEQMGYPSEVINLAKIIVDQDYIGKLLKGNLSYSDPDFSKTRLAIKERAQKNNITPAEYLDLIKTFYLADATSYTLDTEELGGKKSLDNLFEFDREKRVVKLSTNPVSVINYQTPDQYYQIFEHAILQN